MTERPAAPTSPDPRERDRIAEALDPSTAGQVQRAAERVDTFREAAREEIRTGVSMTPSEPIVGDIVLVRLAADVVRPMIVSAVTQVPIYDRLSATVHNPTVEPLRHERRLSGLICCEPDDHTLPALRGAAERAQDPARIHGRPDRYLPLAYGECLAAGPDLGQWVPRS